MMELIVVLVVFLCLILTGMPIALALGASGFLGIVLVQGFSQATAAVGDVPFSVMSNYSLILIPMFILMGVVFAESGVAAEVFRAAARLVGRFPGGLAMSTVVATQLFSGISGSSAADVATVGRISIREMRRHGYPAPYAAATVAASAAGAVLIPPSIALVMYGVLTQESVGELLVAGIIPGALTGLAMCGLIWMLARRRSLGVGEYSVEQIESDLEREADPLLTISRNRPWWYGLAYAATLFLIVMGGIYAGFFSATEAASVGALAAIVLAVVASPRRREIARTLFASVRESVGVSGMIFGVLIGGSIFNYFLTVTGLPTDFAIWISGLDVPPKVTVALLLLALVPLGMFLDGLSLLLITVPVMYPVVETLGFNGVWFGILAVCAIEIGLITPPVGLNVFVVAGIDREVKIESVFRAVAPFVVVIFIAMIAFFLVPDLVTWLPGHMSL